MPSNTIIFIWVICGLSTALDYQMDDATYSHRYFSKTISHIGLSTTTSLSHNGLISIPLGFKLHQIYDYQYTEVVKKSGHKQIDIINQGCQPILATSDAGRSSIFTYKDISAQGHFVSMTVSHNGTIYSLKSNHQLYAIQHNQTAIYQPQQKHQGCADQQIFTGSNQQIYLLCGNNVSELVIRQSKWGMSNILSMDECGQGYKIKQSNNITILYCTNSIYVMGERMQKIKIGDNIEYKYLQLGTTPQGQTLVMVLSQASGLLIYNLQKHIIEYQETFDSSIDLSHLQQIYYDPTTNIIQIVVIDSKKMRQFIIEALYQRNHSSYNLHINKIYHNYPINEDHQIGNIVLGGKSSMNMGIISFENKVIINQYGINRKIKNEDIALKSEFLREDIYTHLVQLHQYPIPQPMKQHYKLAYAILLDKYVLVYAIDPSKMTSINYNCDIPSNFLTDDHYGLKNISILLRGVCFSTFHDYELQFCEEVHQVEFVIHQEDQLGHISERVRYRRYVVFIFGQVCVLLIFALTIIWCWGKLLKKKTNIKQQIRQREAKATNFAISNFDITFDKTQQQGQLEDQKTS